MIKKDMEIIDFSVLEEIILRNRIAVLGLCCDNIPYVVTLSYGYDKNDKLLYFHCAKQGQKINYLRENSNVCLTIIDDPGNAEDECGHSFRSVVIKGEMLFVEDEEEMIKGIKVMLGHFEKNPERIMKKIDEKSKTWLNTQMLKIKVNDITGKERNIQK